jgi:hypothetical protein
MNAQIKPPRLTLSQLADLHQRIRPKKMGIKVEGEIEARIINADGSVDQVVKQSNLSTDYLKIRWMFNNQVVTTMYVFIANDDGWPMHEWKSVIPGNHTTDSTRGDVRSLDSANLIWTFQTTFPAPLVDRVFRYVGLKDQEAAAAITPVWTINNPGVYAATRLTAELTQTTTQTLEITYRLAWQRA